MNKKSIVLCAATAAALAFQAAGAGNTIYLAGSTAFRSAAFADILALPGWSPAPTVGARGGSAASGNNASYQNIHGTYKGVETYVKTFWSGSEAGIAQTAQPGANPVFFLTDAINTISSAQPASGETNTTPNNPDIAMADSSQSVSLTPTPVLVSSIPTNPIAGTVGVVPFTYAKNVQSNPSNFWSQIGNVTTAQARRLLGDVVFPALFTGNPLDTNNLIYAVGRNSFSGTHVDTILTTYQPVGQVVAQFSIGGYPHSNGSSFVAGDPNPTPATGLTDNGYDSGGDVAKALSIDGSCQATDPNTITTGWMAIGYLGMGDAINITNVNNQTGGSTYWLTYNGVAESDGAVEEGQYSYWNYEHELGRVGISGPQLSFAQDLANNFSSQLGGSNPAAHSTGIAFKFMHAQKSSDTSDPFHLGQPF